MYKVYILFSVQKDRYYISYTGDDLKERIRKHNSNHKGFTRGIGDWVLRHFEIFEIKATAIKRETEIKNWKKS